MKSASREAITRALDYNRSVVKRADEAIESLQKSLENAQAERAEAAMAVADLEADLRDAPQ